MRALLDYQDSRLLSLNDRYVSQMCFSVAPKGGRGNQAPPAAAMTGAVSAPPTYAE